MARRSSSSRPSSSRPSSSRPSSSGPAKKAAPAPAVEAPEDAVDEELALDEAEVDLDESADLEESEALEDDLEEADLEESADLDDEDDDAGTSVARKRTAQADKFWDDVRVQIVEIALPKGVGYTLRAYRLNTELTPTEVEVEEDEFAVLRRPGDERGDDELVISDEEIFGPGVPVVEELPEPKARRKRVADDEESSDEDDVELSHDDELDDETEPDDELDEEAEAGEEEDAAEDEEEDEDDEEEAVEEPEPEEVPAFLGHRGRLFLFRTPEGLVEFVKSDAEHDLAQLDTWEKLTRQINQLVAVPKDEDRYELDLVVENLRGGRDAWDPGLLIAAGEVARDLAYALRLEAVRTALSPGSPLDDLDEALRADANGGVSGFFARRKLKKIGAQQAALGWRTIIGKISASVDWRD